jgi:pyruvate dehydrogenase E1 component beta subunit
MEELMREMREITFREAIIEAYREEMRRDERVFIMGEDVGRFGGAYKLTKGLIEEFGPERLRDTPISEEGFLGAGIGAAITGMRPVVEVMFVDFLNSCMNQLVNMAPKLRYSTGGQLKVPLVITSMISNPVRALGADHAQDLTPWFLNVPGFKVALPSTPYDAKGLLKTAIRDDNPVLFFIPYALLGTKGPVPDEEYTIPFGKANLRKKGSDLTVVAISAMVPKALRASSKLEEEGVSVEVIDPRTLVPLDKKAIIGSVKKTKKLITVEGSHKRCGVGSEMAAMIIEEAFDYLDAPIMRVAAPDIPTPASPPLEKCMEPDENDIITMVKKLGL